MNQVLQSIRRWGELPWLILFSIAAWGSPEAPVITSVRVDGSNVVVTAQVPPGVKRLTLETRSRLDNGSWTPRAVARPDTDSSVTTFRVALTAQLEVLRVRADDQEPLPRAFYSGTNSFPGQPVNSGSLFTGMPTDGREDDPAAGGTTREVAESDIWKIRGDTLYFFNQYRGLQVLDISNPDLAKIQGTLPLPASGEQMYLLDDTHVVLLAYDGCGWVQEGPASRVLVVRVENGSPSILSALPVDGNIQESRLVGTALYVASQSYRVVPGSNGGVWEWGTIVSSFDLSDRATPVARDTLWFPGYGAVLSATDRYFFVATQDPSNWRQSIVRTIDISDAGGAMRVLNTVRPAGVVKDKFKLNVSGEVFTVISEVGTTSLFTRLETFSFEDPVNPRKLGELSLGQSEQLHATRFDGDRVYVVTYFVPFRMDPLWMVDLSDPSRPAITGQLEIPGWSTYLHPLGNRLVAAGIETNQTTVSLFDVADPRKPALLSRVALGSGWSWSEANMDEKAFNVLTDAGLILLPYQSWTDGESALRVQLIDLLPDSLVARGAVDHGFLPRRATVHRDRVISLSGTEFLSVDAADRDHPKVKADVALAWSVDRVFLNGEHLIELTGANAWWWWDPSDHPVIRVAPSSDPGRILNEFELELKLPIVGAELRDGRLYLAQAHRSAGIVVEAGDTNSPTVSTASFHLTIYDVSDLPAARVLGRAEVVIPKLGWGGLLQSIWPKPGLLVLASAGNASWYPWLGIGFARPMLDGPGRFAAPWYWGGGTGGRLIAFDVSDAANPAFLSDVSPANERGWNFSSAYPIDGRVYLSHQELVNPPPVVKCDETTGRCETNSPPEWFWLACSFLDVVDYGDPKAPVIREPSSLPGALKGVSHGGELLYTVGPHWRNDTNWWHYGPEFLDASAYDGVQVHLVDSLELSPYWLNPVLIRNDNVFIGRSAESSEAPSQLEVWKLSPAGRFGRVASVEVPAPVQALASFGDLLATQGGEGTRLYDIGDPEAPAFLGGKASSGCYWYDLGSADGTVEDGLRIPLGLFGVEVIEVNPVP